jgi:phospholipid/cholesterol/gamma-HCH transport system permease protein
MATRAMANRNSADGAATFVLNDLGAGAWTIKPVGQWITRKVADADGLMRKVEAQNLKRVELDMSGVTALDTAGAWILDRTVRAITKSGGKVTVLGENPEWRPLIAAVRAAPDADANRAAGPDTGLLANFFERAGRLAYAARGDFLVSMHMLGATVRGAQMKIGRDHGISPAAIVHQLDRMGVGALPVVVLMSFIIGAIIAQQGAFQLRYFGAEIFVVDLVGVLVLREIGVLLTAIMVAGRSGSAITAEIGSMKMREEVDALKVIGLNPIGVLVFPRMVALVIALPLLTVVSDLAALFGASMVAWSYSGISPDAFISRLREAIDLSTYFAGMIKAPFMAMIIGIVASVEGMKVGGSAESLGRHVTASVVKAIFVVIVVDGLFAMFYAAIDF